MAPYPRLGAQISRMPVVFGCLLIDVFYGNTAWFVSVCDWIYLDFVSILKFSYTEGVLECGMWDSIEVIE